MLRSVGYRIERFETAKVSNTLCPPPIPEHTPFSYPDTERRLRRTVLIVSNLEFVSFFFVCLSLSYLLIARLSLHKVSPTRGATRIPFLQVFFYCGSLLFFSSTSSLNFVTYLQMSRPLLLGALQRRDTTGSGRPGARTRFSVDEGSSMSDVIGREETEANKIIRGVWSRVNNVRTKSKKILVFRASSLARLPTRPPARYIRQMPTCNAGIRRLPLPQREYTGRVARVDS